MCSKWVSRGIRDRYFFVGIIHARRDIEARVGILTGRICLKVAGIGGPEMLLQPCVVLLAAPPLKKRDE